nr:hypothetical protein [uncultured Comamonas sp.]
MKPTNTNTQEVERQIEGQGAQSAEQAAELAALQAMAGPVPGQEESEGEQEVAAVPDLAQELAGIVQAAVGMLAPMFPSLPGIYTPEATQAAAAATAAVCRKHGWMQGGMMGRWGEEIACAVIVGPLAFATYHGVKADIAARQPAEPSRSGELNLSAPVPTAPGTGKGVTFGAPVPVGEAAAA